MDFSRSTQLTQARQALPCVDFLPWPLLLGTITQHSGRIHQMMQSAGLHQRKVPRGHKVLKIDKKPEDVQTGGRSFLCRSINCVFKEEPGDA